MGDCPSPKDNVLLTGESWKGQTMIDLKGVNKAKALAALYNASQPLGMGFLQYDPTPMTEQEAGELLQQYTYFDYLKGRVMKVDLSGDSFDPWLYDRDNGEGAAARALESILTAA